MRREGGRGKGREERREIGKVIEKGGGGGEEEAEK